MGYISVVESLRISSTCTCMQCAAKATEFAEIAQTITPFNVIQGHRFWYQSKAHLGLPISD